MLITTEKPECFDRLKAAFGDQIEVYWNQGLIITYDGQMHTKTGAVSPELLAHEMVHLRQQEIYTPEEYLEKYITNPLFRLESEIEAYRAQLAYLRKNIFDRNQLVKKAHKMCVELSSDIYGSIINYKQAHDRLCH